MGEIAQSLLDGEFDYITGEYIGPGVGHPRTMTEGKEINPIHKNKNIVAMNSVGVYLQNNKITNRKEKREIVKQFSEEFLMLEYKLIGFDRCCSEILKCFAQFKEWVIDYKKAAFK